MNIKVFTIVSGFLFLLFLSSNTSFANSATNYPSSSEGLIDFSLKVQSDPTRFGESLKLIIEVSLQQGWHIYSVIPSKEEDAPPPTKVIVDSKLFKTDGPVFETRPDYRFEEILNLGIYYHEDKAELYQNLNLRKQGSTGEHASNLKIHYQLCTDKICLPIESQELKFTYRLEAGEPREEFLLADRSINPLPVKSGISRLSGMLSEGIWAFIGLAALMGLASLMTPCVFPMIPITITFFSKQAEGSQAKVVKLAVLFSAGIIVTYTGFGLLMSILFGAGSVLVIASNPFVNLAIAVVFIIFAFSLMGVFNISLPSGIATYFDQKSRTMGGATGVLLMGFTFTITAFTCTVQFVGTMLIAASQGQWIWPLLGMLVFSTVFAFPFFLLAVAPSLVKKMQGKSGKWLGRSKFVLGVLELMASVKFLSNADLVWQTELISRNTAITIWIVLFLFIIVYLTWSDFKTKTRKSIRQWLSIAVFAVCIVLLSRGLDDRSLGSLVDAVLPPPSGVHQTSDDYVSKDEVEAVKWFDSIEEGIKQASQSNKPIFLEFTGYTCVNCRWMEQNVLAQKSIHNKLSENYILVRLYTDGGEATSKNLNFQINQFHTVALPFYVIMTKDGNPLKTFSGISLDPKVFLYFISEE